jgi:hypothetical protein
VEAGTVIGSLRCGALVGLIAAAAVGVEALVVELRVVASAFWGATVLEDAMRALDSKHKSTKIYQYIKGPRSSCS